MRAVFHRLEDTVAGVALLAMMALPLAEIVARRLFEVSVPGALPFTYHLTLWVGFLGAAMAARQGKLLALARNELLAVAKGGAVVASEEGTTDVGSAAGPGWWSRSAQIFTALVASGVTTMLFWASVEMVRIERGFPQELALGVEVWMAQLVLPLAFGLIALRLVWRASPRWWERGLAAVGLAVGSWLALHPEILEFRPAWPALVLIAAATVLGGPIFVTLGGAALFLFLADGVPIAAVPAETYRLGVNPILPAIPLFTLTGFLLAEGETSQRLIRVFRALVGWMPGGTAVTCAVVCAFFTAFTGGSGVTILALGLLLFKALQADRYRETFSLGLLTASGSLGLLFAPALPLILYGIVAQVSVNDLFIAGALPGALLVLLVAAWGIREGLQQKAQRHPFEGGEALRALWGAKWELILPVVVLGVMVTGVATPLEAAAVAALYALFVQCVVYRDLSFFRGVPRVLVECVTLVGGVLIILGVAMGLTNYLVDAQVPDRLVDWAGGHITSPLVFLLALNVFLLLVGCLMDVFSATVVVVPLITPLGLAFGIDPVHLGIIFIANLELGYITPPVGLNLFLASYRFDRPLLQVYRAALPMLLILGIGVLLITYFPPLTLGLLDLFGRR